MKDSDIVAVMATILHANRSAAESPGDAKTKMQSHVDVAWDLFITTRYRESSAHKRNPAEPYGGRG